MTVPVVSARSGGKLFHTGSSSCEGPVSETAGRLVDSNTPNSGLDVYYYYRTSDLLNSTQRTTHQSEWLTRGNRLKAYSYPRSLKRQSSFLLKFPTLLQRKMQLVDYCMRQQLTVA